VKKSAGK